MSTNLLDLLREWESVGGAATDAAQRLHRYYGTSLGRRLLIHRYLRAVRHQRRNPKALAAARAALLAGLTAPPRL